MNTFVQDSFCLDDYLETYTTFETKQQHIEALARCIAKNTKGGYIYKDSRNGQIVYVACDNKTMFDKLNCTVVYGKTRKQRSLTALLKSSDVAQAMAKFRGCEILTDNPQCLQLYRPPVGEYDKALIEEFIEFMKTRVVSGKALMEEFMSHAYRFRHREEFIEKFFIHYGQGNSGKSFSAACIGSLYGVYANCGDTPEKVVDDQFDSWQKRLLMLHMEEAENENYRNKKMETAIKRLTTINSSARAMYRESESIQNKAICGMNTNQSDLYGLIRGDEALLSRLVIIEFKPRTPELDWEAAKKKFIKNSSFACSLYKYLLEDLEIAEDFSPCRYRSSEKDEFIKNAKKNSKTNIEEWIETIAEERIEIKDASGEFKRVKLLKKYKINGVDHYFAKPKDLVLSYKNFCKQMSYNFSFKSQNVIESLVEMGWTDRKTTVEEFHLYGIRLLRIPVAVFNDLVGFD